MFLETGIMVNPLPESDFGTIFQKFLQDPNVNRVLDRGIKKIKEDRIRAEREKIYLLHLNNHLDLSQ